jgi:hypothetical protein
VPVVLVEVRPEQLVERVALVESAAQEVWQPVVELRDYRALELSVTLRTQLQQ